jgi:hypothetical protein
VDWDLVLTSGHCVDAIPLDELRIAFDYYYESEGQLGTTAADIYEVKRVLTSRRDPEAATDATERLDYAWLQLEHPVRLPHRPARLFTRTRGVVENDPVISIGAGGGVPIKWDAGGHVQDTREAYDDYFVADTDTSQGSSGGGVFDSQLAVVGSLARGAADFAVTPAGCYVTSSESDPAQAHEQFTYAHRAVEGLCASGYSGLLCDDSCEEPCDAGQLGPPPEPKRDSGCALCAGSRSTAAWFGALPALLALMRRRAALSRRRARSARSRR